MTQSWQDEVRVHPGIIAAVVVVALMALLAAIFIIKKYCFSESNITYRYSTLRSHHEELDNSTTNRLQEDSDEDLLE
ncbi:sortilin-like isoform X1 [Dendropsophus ebraccatus]|uniref:sortilin-like isoform X1 n=1 Tax=Dendropsophus ebraccatus TaxID=150705 RepID=UPI0038313D46